MKKEINREKEIIKVGSIGIATNAVLIVFKAIIGFLSGAVSIVLDAVNNLTDVLGSVITIIGTKIANRPADKKHPLGHGRFEYITSMLVSFIILGAGVTAIVESIKKIIEPNEVSFNVITIVIISVAVVAKLVLGLYTQKKGRALKSETLIGSGKDAMFDAIVSSTTLVGIIIFMAAGINIDGYLGALVSVFIIKAGIELFISAVTDILGKRADASIVKEMTDLVIEKFPEVYGVYDVFLENYGPDKITGSFHIEVSKFLTADDIDLLTRKITSLIYQKYQFIVTVGIYAIDDKTPEEIELKNKISEICLGVDGVLQLHGYRHFKEQNVINFDIVKDFKIKDNAKLVQDVRAKLNEFLPQYNYIIVVDTDVALTE